MIKCPLFNRFDCRWEEQSLQRMTIRESLLSNVFQRLGKSKESKSRTTKESILFNSLDIVAHNDGHEMSTLIECILLDNCDAAVDNHMSDVFGNLLVVETLVDVKLHFYFVRNMVYLINVGKIYIV